MRSLAFLALLTFAAAAPAYAASPRFVGTFQDWNVYAVDDSNGRNAKSLLNRLAFAI